MTSAFERAWALMKMPVVDTDVPGVRMAYQQKEHLPTTEEYGADQQVKDALNHPKGMIGVAMGLERYKRIEGEHGPEFDYNSSKPIGKLGQMTPNQYVDNLKNEGYKMPDRNAKYRWKDKGEDHIQNIIQGVKDGQVMGMPSVGHQEGGHRMEALRQMGHGDTEVPVLDYRGDDQ